MLVYEKPRGGGARTGSVVAGAAGAALEREQMLVIKRLTTNARVYKSGSGRGRGLLAGSARSLHCFTVVPGGGQKPVKLGCAEEAMCDAWVARIHDAVNAYRSRVFLRDQVARIPHMFVCLTD